jgi:hypothetical protein
MANARRPTKAQSKRAQVEAARAAMARTQRRDRRIRVGIWSAAGLVVIAILVTAIVLLTRPDKTTVSTAAPTAAASAVGRTTNPPWGAPADPSAAAAAAGLPMLGAEGTALHIHAHLDVIADGTPVEVPADIGIDVPAQKISPLHTHDTTGVIHVESPTKSATFTLGQFFDEWQVSLSPDHIGGLTTDGTHQLKVYVNGKVQSGDPTKIVLAAHDEIAIVYGTAAQQTNVPSSYQWTNGL